MPAPVVVGDDFALNKCAAESLDILCVDHHCMKRPLLVNVYN